MATELDNRIVSMSFDNKIFERDLNNTMKSLDKMDAKLNSLDGSTAFAGLNRAAQNVDLTPVSSAVYALSNGFSTMQIVGMTAIQNITNAVIGLGRTIWGSTIGQIKSGGWKRALNIQQAEFMMEGLHLDVQQLKEDAMYAVEGTAYGFDEAAIAASQLGVAGVKAGQDMKDALLGVSGVAAMTGRDYSNIADIFVTAATRGRVMGDEITRLSYAGINAREVLAKELHKTTAEIDQMVKKGQISFKDFSNAMNNAFGEHAKDANKTFTGAMSNIRAALSRIGAEFASPLANDFIPVLNDFREILNKIKTEMSPITDMFSDWSKIISHGLSSFFDKVKNSASFFNIFHGIEHLFMGFLLVLNSVRLAFKETFPEITSLSDAFRRFTLYLIPSADALEGIKNIFKVLFSFLKVASDVITFGVKAFGVILKIVTELIDGLLSLAGTFGYLLDPYVEWIKQNDLVSIALKTAIGFAIQFVYALGNVKDVLIEISKNEKFQSWVSSFLNVISNLGKFFEELASNVTIVDFAIVGLIVSLVVLYEFIQQLVLKSVGAFVTLLGGLNTIGTRVSDMFSSIAGTFRAFTNVLNKVAFDQLATLIFKFAVSVGILTISLKALAGMDWNELIRGGVAILFLSTVLVAATTAFNKINTTVDGDKGPVFILPFMFFATAVAIVGATLKKLGKLSSSELVKGITALYFISGMLALMSKISETSAGIDTAGFLVLSVAVFALSFTVARLGNMSAKVLAKGTAVILALGLIMKILAGVKSIEQEAVSVKGGLSFLRASGTGTSLADGMMEFALSMIVMAGAINILTRSINMDPAAFGEALLAILFLTLIAGLMQECSKRVNVGIQSEGFIKFAACIGLLSLSITSLTLLAHTDPKALDIAMQCVIGLISISVGVAYLNKQYELAGVNSDGLLKFAWALSSMGTAISILSVIAHFDPIALDTAMQCIIGLVGIVAAMMYIDKELGGAGINSGGFLAFSACIAILSFSIIPLALIGSENVQSAVWAIFELSIIIGVVMKISSEMGGLNSSGFLELAFSIAILSASIVTLTRAINKNPDMVGDALFTMLSLFVLVGVFQKLSDQTNVIRSSGMVVFATGILILSGAVAILTSLPVGKMIAASIGVGILATALGYAGSMAKNFDIPSATGLAIIAGSLVVLAGALYLLANNVPQDSLWSTVVALSAMSVVLGELTGIITNVNILDAASFAVLAGSTMLLAGALRMLGDVPADHIWSVAIAISVFAAAMAGIGYLADGASLGILAIAAVLVATGVYIVSIAAAVDILSNAFMTFTDALHNLAALSDDDVHQIINNLVGLVLGLSAVCDAIVAVSPKFSQAAVALGTAVASAVLAIVVAIAQYAIVGMILFSQLLIESMPILLDAFMQILDIATEWAAKNYQRLYDFGVSISKAVWDGIWAGSTGFSESLYDKTLGKGNLEYKEEMAQLGKEAGETYYLNMLEAMDMYKQGEVSADFLVAGLQAGIENGFMTEEEVMRELAARGLESFNDELGIASPSKAYEESGEFSVDGLIEGVKNKKGDFGDTLTDLAEYGLGKFKEAFNLGDGFTSMFGGSSKDWNAEGMKWVAGAYAYQRAGFDSIEAYVEEMESRDKRRMYKDMLSSITDELGIDVDSLLPDVSKSLDGVTSSLGNLSGSMGTATEKTDALNNAIKSSLDVFSQFNNQVGTTGRQVLQNFMSQINGVSKWSAELTALSDKGLNANFLVELADQGPAAYDKIHALYTMTNSELTLFNQMYAKKLSMQRDTAKNIRDSFVKNGAMTETAAAEYGKKISEATASGVESGADSVSSSMTKTEITAAENAAEETRKHKIDDVFISQWANGVTSSAAKLTMSEAFSELGLASMDAFKQSMNFEVILDQLIVFKNGIKDQVRSALNLFDEVAYKTDAQKKAEEKSTQSMLYSMTENVKKVGRWATNIQTLSERGLSEGLVDQLRQLGPEGADTIDAFVRMSDKELKKANAVYESSLKIDEYTSDKIVSSYSKAGFATAMGLKKGLNDGKDDLLFAYQEVGSDASEGFVEGIDPTAANEAMMFLGENSLSALKTALDSHSPSKETEKIGMDTTEGYILGIESPSRLANALTSLATKTLDIFTQMLGPDKFRFMGLECIDGFARGIIEGLQTKVYDIMSIFSISMLSINENLKNPDNSFKVNIVPVVDQDALNGTSTLMNDFLSSKNFDISATVNRANGANKTNPDNNHNILVEAIRGLKEEIHSIKTVNEGYRSEMGSLRDAITGMKVVMDTGALVGQITNPLDAALGTKAVRSLRRRG